MADTIVKAIWLGFVLCCITVTRGAFSDAPTTEKPVTLHWDASLVPTFTNVNSTRLIDAHTVRRDFGGKGALVRSVESITPASGTMSWRLALEGGRSFHLGVVSAEYKGDVNTERVWVTDGDGREWDAGRSKKKNVNNEKTGPPTHVFSGGDVVVVTYDPLTQLLTFGVESRPEWNTTRWLGGDGLGVVHPCVFIVQHNRTSYNHSQPFGAVQVLSRGGISQQEFEQLPGAVQEIQRLRVELHSVRQQCEKEKEELRKELWDAQLASEKAHQQALSELRSRCNCGAMEHFDFYRRHTERCDERPNLIGALRT